MEFENIRNNNPHVIKYLEVRKIHQEVMNYLNNYCDNQQMEPNKLIESIKDELESKCLSLDFDNRLDNQIYADLLFYPHSSIIPSATELALTKHLIDHNLLMLEAMKDSQIGFYEIIKRDDINAITTLKNIITKEIIELTDLNMGSFGHGTEFYYFLRIIKYQEINFQTGMLMTFAKNGTTQAWIKRHRRDFMTNQSAKIIIDLFNFYQKNGNTHRYFE